MRGGDVNEGLTCEGQERLHDRYESRQSSEANGLTGCKTSQGNDGKGAQVAWKRKVGRGRQEGSQGSFEFSQWCHTSSCLTFKGDHNCRRPQARKPPKA